MSAATMVIRLSTSGVLAPLRAVQSLLRAVGRDVDALQGRLNVLGGGLGRVSASSGRLSAASGRASNSLGRQGRAAQGAAVSHDRLDGSVRRSNRSLGNTSLRAGAATAALVALTAASAGVGASVSNFTSFEAGMSGVEAVTGSTAAEMVALTDRARDLGETTVFSATQAAEGMNFLGRAGFDTQAILSATGASLDLAAAGVLSLGESADITSNVVSTWSLYADESRRVADVLALSAASANTNVRQMGDAFKFVGPVASVLGRSIEETGAAVGVLSDRGIQAEMAGTGLRRIFQGLVAPTNKAVGALAKYGLTVEDVNPATQDLTSILEKLKDVSTEDVFTLFAQRGGTAFLALRSGREDVAALTETLYGAEGAAARMAATMTNNLQGSVLQLKSAAESTSIELGQGMSPALRQSTQDWTDFLRVNRETAAHLGERMGGALSLVSDALLVTADNAEVLKAVLLSLLALKVYATLTSWAAAATAATGAVTVLGVAMGPLTVALVALTAAFSVVDSAASQWAVNSQTQIRAVVAEGAELRNLDDRVAAALSSGSRDDIGKELDALSARLEDAETDLQAAEAQVVRWTDALSLSKEGVNATAQELARMREELTRAQQARGMAAETVREHRDAVDVLLERYVAMEGATADGTDALDALRAELAATGDAAADAESPLDRLTAAMERQRAVAALMADTGLDATYAAQAVDVLLSLGEDPASGASRDRVLELIQSLRQAEAAALAVVAARDSALGPVTVETVSVAGTLPTLSETSASITPRAVESEWRQAVDAIKDEWQTLAGVVASSLASAFSGLDEQTARVLDGVTQIAGAYQAAASGDPFAAAQVGGGIANVGIGLGLYQGQRGTGSFGGQLSGDYSEAGGQIGAVVGTFVGAPGIGTMVGGLIGTVIGGAIKSGADEGLGELRQVGDEVALSITKDEGGLGSVVGQVGDAVIGALSSLENLLGGEIQVGNIGLKVRDDLVVVFANGLRREFESIEAAADFAVIQALKSAEFGGGLSPEAEAVLQGGAFETVEQLQQQLALALRIEEMGIPEAQRGLRALRKDFQQAAAEAKRLGIPLKNLFLELSREYAKSRDEILGIEKDLHQQVSEEARAWNAERSALIADAETELNALLEALALAEQAQASGDTFESLMQGVTDTLVGSGAFAGEEIGRLSEDILRMGGTAGASSAVLQEQISAIQGMLAQLPAAISEGEVRQAVSRRRTGSGRSRGDGGAAQREEQRADFRAELHRLRQGLGETAAQIDASIRGLSDLRAEILKLGGLGEDFANEFLSVKVKEAIRDFLAPFREIQRAADESDGQTAYRHLRERYDEQIEAARAAHAAVRDLDLPAEDGPPDKSANAGIREILAPILEALGIELGQFADDVIDRLGLPLEQARDRAAAMGDEVELLGDLLDDGVISLERYEGVLAELSQQAEASLLGIAAELYEGMGETEEAARIRADLERLSFQLKVAELKILYDQYHALGLIGDEVGAVVDRVLAAAEDFDWDGVGESPSTPAADPASPSGSAVNAHDEREREMERIRQSLAAWRELDLHPVVRDAQRMTAQLEDLQAAASKAVGGQALLAEITAAWQENVAGFVDRTLGPYEDLDRSDLAGDADRIVRDFDAIRQAFAELGVAADAWDRVDLAEAAAWEAFWEKATKGLRGFLDELDASDPRVSGEERFLEAQARFRDLRTRAEQGDLAALEDLTAAARDYHQASRSYLGGGVGTHAVLDELQATRDLIDRNPFVDATTGAVEAGNAILGDIRDGIRDLDLWRPVGKSLDIRSQEIAAAAFARAVRPDSAVQAVPILRVAGRDTPRVPEPFKTPSPPPKSSSKEKDIVRHLEALADIASRDDRRQERRDRRAEQKDRRQERRKHRSDPSTDQVVQLLSSILQTLEDRNDGYGGYKS